MRLQLDRARGGAPGVQGGHQLADPEDQDILVVDRRQTPDRRRHGDLGPRYGCC